MNNVPVVVAPADTVSRFAVPSTYRCRHSLVELPKSTSLSVFGIRLVLNLPDAKIKSVEALPNATAQLIVTLPANVAPLS